MRNYRRSMKYHRSRTAKKGSQRQKLPTIGIFLIAFAGSFAIAEAYLAGWLNKFGSQSAVLASAMTAEFSSTPSQAPASGPRLTVRSAVPAAVRFAPSAAALPPPRSSSSPDHPTAERASFSFCQMGGRYNCVVDGDTIWFKGTKVRIADIDAPETHDYKCQYEKDLGDRATVRLHELLQSGAISFEPIDRDVDRYGRKLRIVLVDGVSVGETLVSERLARWYEGGRRPWC